MFNSLQKGFCQLSDKINSTFEQTAKLATDLKASYSPQRQTATDTQTTFEKLGDHQSAQHMSANPSLSQGQPTVVQKQRTPVFTADPGERV